MPDRNRPRYSFPDARQSWDPTDPDNPDPFFDEDAELMKELAMNPLIPMPPPGSFFPECSFCGSDEPPVNRCCTDDVHGLTTNV